MKEVGLLNSELFNATSINRVWDDMLVIDAGFTIPPVIRINDSKVGLSSPS